MTLHVWLNLLPMMQEPAPSYTPPTVAEWTAALLQARASISALGNRFGFPDRTTASGVRGAVTIYAWNELAEG